MMSDEQLYQATGQIAISVLLRQHRLRWLGHVWRRPDCTMVKQLMFATGPQGVQKRVMGGPSNTWGRVAKADLTQLMKKGMPWTQLAQNREKWSEFVRSTCRSNVG